MEIKKLFSAISKLSRQYTTKLTTLGFSQSECNQALLLLCTNSTENTKEMNLTLREQLNTNNLIGEEVSNKVFEKVLMEELRKHRGGIMVYLEDVVGKLEIGVAELEELEEENPKIKMASFDIECIHTPEELSNKSIEINSQEEPGSEADQKSNFASTEADSLLNHESHIESSLQNLILKTKILKAMLEKQMVSVEALNMGTREYYPLRASGSFMGR